MYKKIDIFINGKYWASTNWHKRCKDAINSIKINSINSKATVLNNGDIFVTEKDKITAFFSKGG